MNMVFSVLSDPTRRAVLEQLTQGPAPVSQLHAPHDMALSSFLKHLGKLEAAGLIRSEKKGRVRTIYLEEIPLREAEHWLAAQRRNWSTRLDRLAHLAAQMKGD